MTRNKLIDIVKDPNLEVETLETAMQQYFSLLLGLIFPPKGKPMGFDKIYAERMGICP